MTALFLNADINNGTKLNINAALLRYPMLAHYQRSFPGNGQPLNYMNHKVSEDDAKKQAEAIVAAVQELERYGLVPTRAKGYAPQYMAPAFLLSTTKKWKDMFKRKHEHRATGDSRDNADCIERASKCLKDVEHKYLPPIVVYHGHDDTNCPYEDAEQFKEILTKYKPSPYIENETFFLERVTQLSEKNGVAGNQSSEVGHGFDYALSAEREPFLKRAYERVDGFWPMHE